jgi:hypothetical protein
MKKPILSLFTLLLCIMGLVACNSNSPKTSAEKFLNGFTHLDYEAAKSVSTEETKKSLDLYAQFSTMMPDSIKTEAKKIKVVIKDEKIEGDKATVTYTTSEDGNKQERKLDLIKKDNKWLVAWNKEDMMGGGNDQEIVEPNVEENMSMDTTVAPPADAIPDSVK